MMTKLIFPQGWYVPSFETILEQSKKNNYCVVIPVINEGDRIQNLLRQMDNLKICESADIIIVDGGSSDGSLDIDLLKAYQVNTLLLKTGPGKLSAQLLCGYAFSLMRNYKGIITIDGNNKDDPKSIFDFIEKLDEGYDFIQASRFIENGIAENTPKIRDFAIRYIHAPLLSFFSGFHWTDTTQGFRGYSFSVLKDESINIFRPIFKTYELLAYLSYITPKKKYKCIEIGTTRRYPKGDVPTKISAINGNWLVLKILFKACLGRYNAR